MLNRQFTAGMIAFGAGLLASSISSLLGHFVVLGSSTSSVQGFFDGLSAVAYCVAIWLLVRSRRTE